MNSAPSPALEHGSLIRQVLIGASIGLIVAAVSVIANPRGFEATSHVLVTRFDTGVAGFAAASQASIAPGAGSVDDAADADDLSPEIEFAQSFFVRDGVRSAIPTAPNTIDITRGTPGNTLRFTAAGDSRSDALRLSRNWAGTYISRRHEATISAFVTQIDNANAELANRAVEIADARERIQVAPDPEAEATLARRDEILARRASLQAELDSVSAEPGAQLFVTGDDPVSATGRPVLSTLIIGIGLGAAAGAVRAWWNRRRSEDQTEARLWLRDTDTTGATDTVGQIGTLGELGLFGDPEELEQISQTREISETSPGPVEGLPLQPVEAVDGPMSMAAPVEPSVTGAFARSISEPDLEFATDSVAEKGPASTPGTQDNKTATPEPTNRPTVSRPSDTSRVTIPVTLVPLWSGQPRISARDTRSSSQATDQPQTGRTTPPLRVAKVEISPQATTPPQQSPQDRAWADDISLISDRGLAKER